MDSDRAERFARAVIEATEIGRLAMSVLDGGLFAGARFVELAEAVTGAEPDEEAGRLTSANKA